MSVRLVAMCLLAAACGSGTAGSADAPDTFLAFSQNFADFRTWESFHSDGPPDDGTYSAAVLGPRTQYLNKHPAAGSKEFPTGTIVVESRENGTGLIFAAVKRGGGFNVDGATNWEWFELLEPNGVGDVVTIKWRGVGPPAGEIYGGDPNGGCNSCHRACGSNNDFVCSGVLQLPNL